MDNILVLFVCIALSAITILCIVLAIAALRAVKNVAAMTSTMERVGADVGELKSQLIPLIEQATVVITRSEKTLEALESNLQHVSKGTATFERIAGDLHKLEQDLVSRVRIPLTDLSNTIGSALASVSGFVRNLLGG